MDANDHWQQTRDLLWTIEVERENYAVNAFVNQISLDCGVGNLYRPAPRHTRLRDLSTQHGGGDCNGKQCMPPAHQANHSILRCHVADTMLFSRNLAAHLLDWQEHSNRATRVRMRSPFYENQKVFEESGDGVSSYRMLQFLSSGTLRRGGINDLAQPAALVDSLDDVVGSARLRVKLHARQVLDTFGVGAISNMPVAKEY